MILARQQDVLRDFSESTLILGTISINCQPFGYYMKTRIWPKIPYLKDNSICLLSKNQLLLFQDFQMRYCASSWLKELQNCKGSNLEVKEKTLLTTQIPWKKKIYHNFFRTFNSGSFVISWATVTYFKILSTFRWYSI